MLKVVSKEMMRTFEKRAFAAGITEEMLMDTAGLKIKEEIIRLIDVYNLPKQIAVLAGKGNNGGDAYTAAKLLKEHGLPVVVYQVYTPVEGSLLEKKRNDFLNSFGHIVEIQFQALPELPRQATIIDGIFGVGFHGRMDEDILSLIKVINASKLPVISIDIPSGVNGDTGEVLDDAIFATYTLAIEFPKMGFFLGNGFEYVGKVSCLPIELEPFSRDIETEFNFLEDEDVPALLPKIERRRHKYQAGHVVGIGGASGMVGASLLSSWAALRSGCGIVHLAHPEKSSSEFSGVPLEVVKVPFSPGKIDRVKELVRKSTACFVGPGLGRTDEVYLLLNQLWDDFKEKTVIDADALYWLSKYKTNGSLSKLILTPHFGEMSAILGVDSKNSELSQFLKKVSQFASERDANIVLKGAPTFIFSGKDPVIIMTRGDPGMATAGSGDVLTGILAGLLSEGLSYKNAMILGTYLHALSGEKSASIETSYCMMATSLIKYLPAAFSELLNLNKVRLDNDR